MKFKINNDEWTIKEEESRKLKELYEKEMKENTYFVFGLTNKAQHLIYINKDMCEEQKIKTLKHELMHCYIWEYGLYNVMEMNEEVICDIVASSNDFVNEVVNQYLGIEALYLCDANKNIECKKSLCHTNGGECIYTSNKKFARKKRY